jgi:hypothetical protein
VIPKAAQEPEFAALRNSLIQLAQRVARKMARSAP